MTEYQPKNVLITGVAGFIASNVVILLTKKYPDINFIGLDKIDYCSCLENISEIMDYPNFKFIKGDICSQDLIAFILKSENIDTIMNYAASSHVDGSFGNSLDYTRNNVLGVHTLLECAKFHGIGRFIAISTDECLGEDRNDVAMDENSPLNPSNVYSATKSAGECLCNAYKHSFKMPIIITRSNNIYGKHCYPEKIIPKFINRLLRGLPLTIHGTGENMRNYLHTTDIAAAFEIILFKGVAGETYNIAGTNEYTNLEIAKTLLRLMGFQEKEDEMITFVEDRKFNDYRYHITSSLIRSLGWEPKMGWEEGLLDTIQWYKDFGHRYEHSIEEAIQAHPTLR